jgi:transposase-like protein
MDNQIPDPEVPERAKRPRSYSARYKAEILAEYERLDKAGKGALLRREGLYTSLLSEWRKQHDRGALAALAKPRSHPSVNADLKLGLRLTRKSHGGVRAAATRRSRVHPVVSSPAGSGGVWFDDDRLAVADHDPLASDGL